MSDHGDHGEPVHFGERMRSLRGNRSLKEFGRLIGRSASGVRKLENTPNPTLKTLLGIQRALKLASIEELFGRFPSDRLASPDDEDGSP